MALSDEEAKLAEAMMYGRYAERDEIAQLLDGTAKYLVERAGKYRWWQSIQRISCLAMASALTEASHRVLQRHRRKDVA